MISEKCVSQLMNNNCLGRELRGRWGHTIMKQRTSISLKYSCDQMLEKYTMRFLNIVLALKYIHT